MPKLSLESIVEQLKKKRKKNKDLTWQNRLIIENKLMQVKYGFDIDGLASADLADWIKRLGAKKMVQLNEEMKKREQLAAKDNKTPRGWEVLVQ